MADISLAIKAFVALAIGLLIGLERERSLATVKQIKFAGLRTFAIVGALGCISAYLTQYGSLIFIIPLLCIGALIVVAYYRTTRKEQHVGMTTEVSLILTYMLGGLTYFDETVAVILGVILASMLAFKKPLHRISRNIPKQEFYDSLKFALISLVILPILPNRSLGPMDAFNPYEIWLVVVFVSGISFLGYFLVKWMGSGVGSAVTGALGGLASSTAVTTAMASRTKQVPGIELSAILAVTLANVVMLGRVMLVVLIFNPSMIDEVAIPIVTMGIIGLVISAYFYYMSRMMADNSREIPLSTPFSLKPALIFGAFYAVIYFISKVATEYFGNYGLYITAFFNGLADVDAITVTASKISAEGVIGTSAAGTAIMIAVFVNLLIRVFYAHQLGNRQFLLYAIASILIMVTGGIIATMLLVYRVV